MTEAVYGIYGASGYGREVMPLAAAQVRQMGLPADRLVFIDDGAHRDRVNGYRVLSYGELKTLNASEYNVCLAIADSAVRKRLGESCDADRMKPWTISAGNVVVMDDVEIGEGAILSPFVTLKSNIRIGRHFHANIYSYVAHDCWIGDYVTFAPAVKCNGNITIEDHAYIGTGAIIKQGRPSAPLVIGRGAIVGMGAVVTKSVPAGVTVVGNPAKPLVKS